MREKCMKIIDHGINCFIDRQLIYNFPEEIFADHGVMAIGEWRQLQTHSAYVIHVRQALVCTVSLLLHRQNALVSDCGCNVLMVGLEKWKKSIADTKSGASWASKPCRQNSLTLFAMCGFVLKFRSAKAPAATASILSPARWGLLWKQYTLYRIISVCWPLVLEEKLVLEKDGGRLCHANFSCAMHCRACWLWRHWKPGAGARGWDLINFWLPGLYLSPSQWWWANNCVQAVALLISVFVDTVEYMLILLEQASVSWNTCKWEAMCMQ